MWWKFRSQSSLWALFMKHKYCSFSHPNCCSAKSTDSRIWKRLLQVRTLAESFISWGINAGNISFFYDDWSGLGALYLDAAAPLISDISLSELFSDSDWKQSPYASYLNPKHMQVLNLISLDSSKPDQILFKLSNDSKFNMKKIWDCWIFKNLEVQPPLDLFWHKCIPYSVSIFAWRLFFDFIPTDAYLQKLNIAICSKCIFCSNHMEDSEHIFFKCRVAALVWNHFLSRLNISLDGCDSFLSVFNACIATISGRLKGHILTFIPLIICWHIWLARNQLIHISSLSVPTDALGIISSVSASIILRARAGLFSQSSLDAVTLLLPDFITSDLASVAKISRLSSSSESIWLKPKLPFLKLNIHADFKQGSGGVGGILRNHQGDFVLAFSFSIVAPSFLYADLLVLYYGLFICLHHKLRNLWLEFDSAHLFDIIYKSADCPATCFHLVKRINDMLKKLEFFASFLSSEGNSIARLLAARPNCNMILYSLKQLSPMARGLLHLDKSGLPFLCRIP